MTVHLACCSGVEADQLFSGSIFGVALIFVCFMFIMLECPSKQQPRGFEGVFYSDDERA